MPEWMTYEEAGARFGLSAEAMRKRAGRLGWTVKPPNAPGGKALVEVPDAPELRPAARSAGDRPDGLSDELRRRAEAAEAQAGAERQARIDAEVRAARAEGEVAGLREAVRATEALAAEEARRAGEAVQEAAQAQREAEEARQVGEAAQAAQRAAEAQLAAWTAGGTFARAWRAFTRRP